jgi:hypothetical protein
MIKQSKTADGLAQRIVAMLKDSGPRNVMWWLSYAKTEAMFYDAIGRLFVRGQVRFIGKGKGRRLALAGRG